MKIVVLAGGLSTERDVSFKTGDMVAKALRENGHQVILLDVFMGYSDKKEDLTGIFDRSEEVSVKVSGIPEIAPDLAKVKASRKDQSDNFFGPNVIELCQMSDIVFMALHGENGENGKIQAAFDLFGIRYTGTGYLSSALAMDKEMSKKLFLSAGIPAPKGASMKKADCSDDITKLGIQFPCVVKPCCGGSSIGVSIAHNAEEYKAALDEAFRWEENLIVEEYVQGFYDYKNKYKSGSAVETCPAELSEAVTEKMQHYAEQVAQVLGLDTYSRTDFLLDENENIYCLEANTLPGMTPTSLLPQEAQVVGVNFNELCEKLIQISLDKYEK